MTKVLLVEDEDRIRLLIATVLTNQGHTILESEDGYRALNLLQTNLDIQIVITDLVMPHLDGLQLIQIVRNDYPNLLTIAMSAYHEQLEQAQAIGADQLLRKPFSHQQLLDAFNTVATRLTE